MRRIASGTALLLAVMAGVVAVAITTVVHPAQARASQRQIDRLRGYAQQLSPRINAIAATTRAKGCNGDGLVRCDRIGVTVGEATVKIASALQTVTARAPEIQCIDTWTTRFDDAGGNTRVPITDCALIVRLRGHILMIDIRPNIVSRAGPDGSTTLATYVD